MNSPAPNSKLSDLSPLKLTLAARRAREQNQSLLRADPIAIVGMGCRFPGGAESPQAFWTVLERGIDAVTEVPPDRWDVNAHYDPDPAAPGKYSTKSGGFLQSIDGFDAAFFGIMRREAERMDPQQRLILEVAIEALENAGQPRERLAGSQTGVFIASYYNDYAHLAYQDPESIDARTLTGTIHSVLANRLSYLLDLRGPSISVDTACSSSLVAIHLACQSLRFGECDLALAGGVSLMINESLMISLSKVGFMAPDGRCKTFDASANGFGRGEGCGVIILKRLSDAVADGDRVLALIRGSAVNQDGHSTVLAAPNGLAQAALVREALENSQLAASRIGYVEAHGTGTALGDPIEVEALAATVGAANRAAGPCLLGSAKANIGHLEAAAGVVGVVKTTLVLQKAVIPPQVHFSSLNPHISLEGTRLAIPTTSTPWSDRWGTRCAGVSSFGVGGTNAHVIMEEAPRLPPVRRPDHVKQGQMLPLSGQSEEALRELARRWIEFLPVAPHDLATLCACAGERRSHYERRVAVVGTTITDIGQGLQDFLDGKSAGNIARGSASDASASRLAFVFGGQGQQWIGMGRDLLETEPIFQAALQEIDRRFRELSGWSIIDEIAAPEARTRLDETEVAQPVIFALQIALARLWQAWGFVPEGVVGHSVGEIAALHVAGVIDLDVALSIVLHRGRAMQRATGTGVMASVSLTESQAKRLIQAKGEPVSIAAVNEPLAVVLSGDTAAMARTLAEMEAGGVTHRVLPVNYAFHSTLMEPFAVELEQALDTFAVSVPSVAVYSTVTGQRLFGGSGGDVPVDAAYFGRNVRQTVRFAAAVTAMLEDGFDAFLEISAHPVLGSAVAECASARDCPVLPLASLRKGRAARETLLQATAWLYARHNAPVWDQVNGGPAQVVDLPEYPWQRERYWLPEPAKRDDARGGRGIASGHELLGVRIPAADAMIFEVRWPDAAPWWLAHHRIGGRLLVPAAAMVETMRLAAVQGLGRPDVEITDFIVHRAMVLSEGDEPPVVWQTSVRVQEDGKAVVAIHQADFDTSDAPVAWQIVATGTGIPFQRRHPGTVQAGPTSAHGQNQKEGVLAIYAAFESLGIAFGPSFRVLQSIEGGTARDCAWLARSEETKYAGAHDPNLHPTVLDGALQACVIAAAGETGLPSALWLPVGIERYRILADVPDRVIALVSLDRNHAPGVLAATVRLTDERGELVALIEGVRCVSTSTESAVATTRGDAWIHEVVWRVDESRQVRSDLQDGKASAWIVICDTGMYGDELATHLEALGHRCLRIGVGATPGGGAAGKLWIDPGVQDSWRSLFQDSSWTQGLPLAGVVNVLALSGDPGSSDSEHVASLPISVTHLMQAMAGRHVPGGVLALVTRGGQTVGGPAADPKGAALWGLQGVIAVEQSDLQCRVIDLDPEAPVPDVSELAEELLARRSAPQRLARRGGKWLVPRLRRRSAAPSAGTVLRLVVGSSGTLDSLAWHRRVLPVPGPGEVVLNVVAAGINFRDVLIALGMYPGAGAHIGAECAGIVEAVGPGVLTLKQGDAVFGYVPESLASQVVAPEVCLCKLTDGCVTMEHAAALPVAFMTAMVGLQRIAGIKPGQSVLIHAAAGGVGMAAVQLAQRAGAKVLVTAGSESKRSLLRSIGVEHVFDSRTLDFARQVSDVTGGAGVDVVLNSLAGDFIAAGVGVLKPGGWFLELGKRDIWSAERFAHARPDAHYRAYDLGDEVRTDPSIVRPMLELILASVTDGTLTRLPVRAYAFEDAADAFKYMAQARHVGKLVLSNPAMSASTQPGNLVRENGSYLISGGFGGVGLEAGRWLVSKGAQQLILVGRHPPDAETEAGISGLRRAGVIVHVVQADIADEGSVRSMLAQIEQSGRPLRGVLHAAGAVEDGILLRQSVERFESAFRGKLTGLKVLDRLTRELPLDWFVLFSSASIWLGAPGQGPYVAANAEAEAVVRARHAAGLPGLSVAWGQWSGRGMAARLAREGNDAWSARGLGWISPDEGFKRLERLLVERCRGAVVLPIDWARFLERLPEGADAEFFEELTAGPPSVARDGRLGERVDMAAKWRLLPAGRRRDAVMGHVISQALNILGLSPSTPVDPDVPLKELGLDSLMAVELRNALTRSLGHTLSATLLFDYPSAHELTTHLMNSLNLVDGSPSKEGRPPLEGVLSLARQVADLSESDAEAQLLAELDAEAGRSEV